MFESGYLYWVEVFDVVVLVVVGDVVFGEIDN